MAVSKKERAEQIAEFKDKLRKMPEQNRKSFARAWVRTDKQLRRK